jgi:hypothetical protein
MKLLALFIILVALYLLYRIAYPKQPDTNKGNNVPEKEAKAVRNVMGKSCFVLPDRSKPLQTPATKQETDKSEEKAVTFAAETEEKQSAVIPAEQLDEVFGENGNSEIMSIPLESIPDDNDIDFEAEEEVEELNRALGHEAEFADGIDYDDLQTAVKVVKEQPETVSEETGKMLAALENTDMFELLVSGNEGKMSWIKTVIDRHIQSTTPETESKEHNTDYGDFDVADYLS